MSRSYLVTGGAGFIGSHLVEALTARGDAVNVLDDLSTGSRGNLALGAGRIELVHGSVADPASVARAIRGVDGVFHLAALPSVARSVEAPLDTHAANATGTVHILDAARRAKVKVVYAGSSSAYGDNDAPAKSEDMRENPLSPYAVSKLTGELYCRCFANVYGLPVFVTRFFNVYGPRQVPNSPYSGVIAAFCHALLHGTRPRIDGDGKQSRDFTYVGDVARGLLLAMDADLTGCEVVNLAGGASYSLLEMLDALQRHAGTNLTPVFAPARVGDVKHSRADVSRARELLDFSVRVPFAEGLAQTFEWYRSQQK